MRPRATLLLWLMRQCRPVTLAALPTACLYVLLRREVLGWRDPWPAVFVLVHSIAIARCLGRPDSRGFAFVYTRGYSRDALWVHTMLAGVLAALAVWAPAAAIVWTPLRGLAQDALFYSPYFPLMAPREAAVPPAWLAGYGLLLPALQYEWIRRGQPTRGGSGGPFLAAAVVGAAAVLLMEGLYRSWFRWLALAAGLIAASALLIASWRLHRRLEVRS